MRTREERWTSPTASVNSLAMTAAIEYPGWNSERRASGRFPMTIVTAIVSPNARPRPRIVAPKMPGMQCCPITIRSISQRVPPSESTASFCLWGTVASTSRLTDRMNGMIMIERRTPPASMLGPYTGPLKRGIQPRYFVTGFMSPSRRTGTRTKIPHSP